MLFLNAWQELLADRYPNDELIPQMKKDIDRLHIIADRFSKIGSEPELQENDIVQPLRETVSYMRTRVSNKVEIEAVLPDNEWQMMLNVPLYKDKNQCKLHVRHIAQLPQQVRLVVIDILYIIVRYTQFDRSVQRARVGYRVLYIAADQYFSCRIGHINRDIGVVFDNGRYKINIRILVRHYQLPRCLCPNLYVFLLLLRQLSRQIVKFNQTSTQRIC